MKEETKQKLTEIKEKLSKLIRKTKKYFQTTDLHRKLIKKERKITNEITLQKGLIEHYEGRMIAATERIKEYEEGITEKHKKIKQLEKDLEIVRKVTALE